VSATAVAVVAVVVVGRFFFFFFSFSFSFFLSQGSLCFPPALPASTPLCPQRRVAWPKSVTLLDVRADWCTFRRCCIQIGLTLPHGFRYGSSPGIPPPPDAALVDLSSIVRVAVVDGELVNIGSPP